MRVVKSMFCCAILALNATSGHCELAGGIIAYRDLDRLAEPEQLFWTGPVEGLSLGIRNPAEALVFTPPAGWGRMFRKKVTKDGSEWTATSRGEWATDAMVSIYLKNTTNHALVWFEYPRFWSINFESPKFKAPEIPFSFSTPSPLVNAGPIKLEPGHIVEVCLPIRSAFWFWPKVREGKYTVSVEYEPSDRGKIESAKVPLQVIHRRSGEHPP